MLLAGLVGLGFACAAGCEDPGRGETAGEAIGEATQRLVSAPVCVSIRRQGAAGTVFDSAILDKAPPRNHGTSWTMSTGPTSAESRVLLQFDLSAIPSGPAVNITSATVNLAYGVQAPNGPGTIEVHNVLAPWSEATVTWQSFADAFDPSIVTTFSNQAAPSFAITQLVQGWARGTIPNNGVLLSDPGSNYTNFWSSEDATVAARPELAVCYTVTCDPGFADCNGDGADGCEANIDSSAANCGACGVTCPSGVCQNGTCGPVCQPETCNGKDDDCNGVVDDLGSTTCGVGACQVTVQNCVGGVTQACVPLAPQPEKCDGLIDDDCDGVVDNGCACVNGTTQSCYTGAPATLGIGVCQAGVQTCANGQWGACVGEITPSAESCDGKDNDCDGSIDDGNPGGGGTCNTGKPGVCAAGTLVCAGGGLACNQNVQASAEICDGKDNDCDGVIDDGAAASCPAVANGTAACTAGACGIGACNAGFYDCNKNAADGCESSVPCSRPVVGCTHPSIATIAAHDTGGESDIAFDASCRAYLPTIISGTDHVTIISANGATSTVTGYSNFNMQAIAIDPVTGRIVLGHTDNATSAVGVQSGSSIANKANGTFTSGTAWANTYIDECESSIAVDPSGCIWTPNFAGNGTVVCVNITTGAKMTVASLGTRIEGVALDATGALLVSIGSSIVRVNTTNGTTTPRFTAPATVLDFAVDYNNDLYVATTGGQIIRYVAATGTSSVFATVTGRGKLAISPDGWLVRMIPAPGGTATYQEWLLP
ncbi:MAG: DNRLRE domain-containing protein [Minicystis sp.]